MKKFKFKALAELLREFLGSLSIQELSQNKILATRAESLLASLDKGLLS